MREVWEKARGGNKEAIEKLKKLVMNYRENNAKTVPKGAGVNEDASEFTDGQRTQM